MKLLQSSYAASQSHVCNLFCLGARLCSTALIVSEKEAIIVSQIPRCPPSGTGRFDFVGINPVELPGVAVPFVLLNPGGSPVSG